MPPTLQQFVAQLSRSGVLSDNDVSSHCEAHDPEDARSLAKSLVRDGKLTEFQARVIYSGKKIRLDFDKYMILDRIGAGGMGEVFKAKHRHMDRVVALKVLSRRAIDSPDAVKRFQREVRTAAQLEHVNIVTAHDADTVNGVHYLVMQLIDGEDLSSLVKQSGRMTVTQAVDCITQTARGLEYAHQRGVIHRDIKPSNILLDSDGVIKILDMGLARRNPSPGSPDTTEGLTHSGQLMGTLDYMSPEQAEDTRKADERADVYSLGCTLYYLLTSLPVYSGETMTQKLIAHREQAVPSLCATRRDVPAGLDQAFQKMVSKRPEDRHQSMGQVIDDLQSCLEPQKPPPLAKVASASRRPPSTAAATLTIEADEAGAAKTIEFAGNAEPETLHSSIHPMETTSAAAAPPALDKAQARQPAATTVNRRLVITLSVAAVVVVAAVGVIVALIGSRQHEEDTAPAETASAILEEPRELLEISLPEVQGEYVGEANGKKYGMQLVTRPGYTLDAVFYEGGLPGGGWNGTAPTRETGAPLGVKSATFESGHVIRFDGGKISTYGMDGDLHEVTFHPVSRRSPTLRKAAPTNAIVIFDGSALDEFQIVRSSGAHVLPEALTRRSFRDFELHIEFNVSLEQSSSGQMRGNSGVYLQDRYEIQILDSFGDSPMNNGCAAIYQHRPPMTNVCLPPGEWQTYDIDFTAPKFDASGKKTADAEVTVKHNGVLVHNRVTIPAVTIATKAPEDAEPRPIRLQFHGSEVKFRNIWVIEK